MKLRQGDLPLLGEDPQPTERVQMPPADRKGISNLRGHSQIGSTSVDSVVNDEKEKAGLARLLVKQVNERIPESLQLALAQKDLLYK